LDDPFHGGLRQVHPLRDLFHHAVLRHLDSCRLSSLRRRIAQTSFQDYIATPAWTLPSKRIRCHPAVHPHPVEVGVEALAEVVSHSRFIFHMSMIREFFSNA